MTACADDTLVRKGRDEVFHLGSGAAGGWRRQIDGDDVEADRDLRSHVLGKTFAEDAGKRAQNALLVLVDGELGGDDVAAGAGLDLDEAEAGAVPGDEVDIARKARCLPAAGDYRESSLAQVEESFLFALEASEEMGRGLAVASELRGEGVDAVE
jgi:alpha-D-ribose 1-methylphosphonate 5-triphosphate synthase subunit PhnI